MVGRRMYYSAENMINNSLGLEADCWLKVLYFVLVFFFFFLAGEKCCPASKVSVFGIPRF